MNLKKIIPFLTLGFLMACGNAGNSGHEKETKEQEKHEHSEPAYKPGLNNGKKWQLDESTRTNIGEIKALLEGPLASKNADQLGADLQKKSDELISECRMKGPDHDALHAWLEHYLGNLKKFRDPSADRVKAYATLQDDLEEFDKYFE